ncbi:MAG TPA: 2-oxo acid dehydrogenase subunit E2 [Polyangia bacterium]|jgi:pyruvate dehydrogenase E2 component (dihydrolipoamide acetyltransferase)|nr:2-oxo acid dehydrogenase subunit E2 [Polyangia bacterium]
MPHLELERKEDLSSFRKIALGTWRTAYDPSVYGVMELRMEEALRYLDAFRAHTGKRLTISHMLAKCAAAALKECPDANAILRWNHIYLRKRIGVFFQVAMTDQGAGKADLSGATLYDVEQKPLTQIHDEFQAKVDAVRTRRDPALEKTRGLFRFLPSFLVYWVLNAVSFLSYTLNLDLRAFGIPSDPFGSLMITNIGTLGLETAFVPLVPYSRVPILLAVGAVREQPVVEQGRLTVGQVMKISATFDHRFIDGVHAAAMARVLRQWMEHPFEHFDPVPLPAEKALPAAPQQ